MFSTEIWLTPLILLPGVALLIVSTTNRFGQVHTEFHHLLHYPDNHAEIVSRCLVRRSAMYRNALASLYTSVGLFSLGSLLGGVINLWHPELLWIVGGLTILGIACLVYAAIQLLRETLLALDVIQDHSERIAALARQQSAHTD
jgi:hypothetical protein